MKRLLLSFLFLITISSQAQGLQITDLNVTTVEGGVNVNLHTLSLSGAGHLSDSYEILGNTIFVKVCYWFDNTLPVLQFEDNIMVPLETSGDYTVTVNVFSSSSQDICDDFSLAGSQSVAISYLSVTDFDPIKENLILFPNPTNGFVGFHSAINVNGVNVYDSMGRLVKEFRNLTTNKINLEGLSEGMYVLYLQGEKETYAQKILFRK